MGRARQMTTATAHASRGAVASDAVSRFDAVLGAGRGSGRPFGRQPMPPLPRYVGAHPYVVDDAEAWVPFPTMGGPGGRFPNPHPRFFSPAPDSLLELNTDEELFADWEEEDRELLRRHLWGLPAPVCVRVLDGEHSAEEILRLANGKRARAVGADESLACELENSHGDKRVFGFSPENLGLLPVVGGELYRSLVRDIPTPLSVGTTLYRAQGFGGRLLTPRLEETLRSFTGDRADKELLAAIDAAKTDGHKVRFAVAGVEAVGHARDRHLVESKGRKCLGVGGEALVETTFKADGAEDGFVMYLCARDVLRELGWERELGGCPALLS